MEKKANYYVGHNMDERIKSTHKHVKESRAMTELKGNILCLDLANDNNAREHAFSYAVSIAHSRPELADRILTAVTNNESRGRD